MDRIQTRKNANKKTHQKNRKESRQKQLDFFSKHSVFAARKEFGGSQLKSHPKCQRPHSKNNFMRIVLKSQYRPQIISFRDARYLQRIQKTLIEKAKFFHVSLEQFSINTPHIHLLIRAKSRAEYIAFIKTISALIPRIVGEAKKGSAGLYKNLWEARPFSRIVSWGREKIRVALYVPYKARAKYKGAKRSTA